MCLQDKGTTSSARSETTDGLAPTAASHARAQLCSDSACVADEEVAFLADARSGLQVLPAASATYVPPQLASSPQCRSRILEGFAMSQLPRVLHLFREQLHIREQLLFLNAQLHILNVYNAPRTCAYRCV